MVKTAQVYGNGPSRVLYNEHTPKEKDLVVGCNLIEPGINPDIIAVIDSQPIAWMHDNNVYPTAKFWVSNRSMLQLRHYEMLDRIKVEKVWDDIHRYNCGIYAVRECLNQGYNVHLWGFDSMFSDSLESPAMDKIIARHRRPKHLDSQWATHWKKLFNNRKEKVWIHTFGDSNPKPHIQNNDTIRIVQHKELSRNSYDAKQ